MSTNNSSKESIGSDKHKLTFDSYSINKAIEKAVRDEDFVRYAVSKLKDMHFPAYKKDIVLYMKNITNVQDIIALFESLDGYIQFKDQYHVQKALEENIPKKKETYQITEQTRTNPSARTRDSSTTKSTKETEAVNKNEERRKYPEVTPTAMSNFICNICGKPFQNQNDLVQHRRLEQKGK